MVAAAQPQWHTHICMHDAGDTAAAQMDGVP